MLDTSELSKKPFYKQLQELERRNANHVEQARREFISKRADILNKLTNEAKLTNPNYVEHKITVSEIEKLLENMLHKLASLTSETYKTVEIKKSVNAIWKDIAVSKHLEWLNKVKNRNNGYIFENIMSSGFEHQLPSALFTTYKKLDLSRLNYNKTLNQISKQIFTEIWEVMEKEFLKNENAELHRKLITANASISSLTKDITEGRKLTSKAKWQSTAIEMKFQGYLVSEIMKYTGKGKTSIYKALKSEEAKGILNKQ